MKIKVEVNKIVLRNIGREIHLDIGGGRLLEIYKYTTADDNADDYDAGWEADSDETRAIIDKLTDDEKDELDDFINNLDM
jgi:hypothetical protein